jgi:hypothetical protein
MEYFGFTDISAEKITMEHCINHPDKETRFACQKVLPDF